MAVPPADSQTIASPLPSVTGAESVAQLLGQIAVYYGVGQQSCASWGAQPGTNHDFEVESWLLGEVSGLENMCHSLQGAYQLPCLGKSLNSTAPLLTAARLYCRQHPTAPIGQAGLVGWTSLAIRNTATFLATVPAPARQAASVARAASQPLLPQQGPTP
ncbi:hypothetical protein E3E12_02180 [Formicincola oecophyllae]|uniref:Uncharacterized protein n=1 Tax=Formicincola oecophyllae TaxID=2558361 RepID=A0A4Y6UA01_9PROT|nr:hypothetical protein [Formicincola oecophyllae]QDH13201.1 hypothetical protein E3E12_02180 [Formicincola oecophyllae]